MSRIASLRGGPLARRLRLTLFAVGALSIAVAVAVFYTLWSQQTLSLRLTELERQVGVIASGVAVGDVVPGSIEDSGQVRARLLKVEAGLIAARLAVTDGAGTVLYGTAGSQGAKSYPIADLSMPGSEFAARSAILDLAGVGSVAVVAVPASFDAPGKPRRYLVGARPLADIRRADAWVLASIAAAALIALVLAAGSGTWLARRITGPIVRLTDGANAVAEGQWGSVVPVEGSDEVAQLAAAFNEMSERVADTLRAQQEFVGDVSHELRTPITSIRGFADALLDGTVGDEAGMHRAAGIIRAEADRLADLTSVLLSLADLDAGAVEMCREPIDVAALADTLRVRFGVQAAARGLTFRVDPGDAVPLGDGERLLQAVSALVENALRYTPDGGRIHVGAGARGDRWRMQVEDDGPGIAVEDRERVFGRFTKLDPSRASADGGSGLGLAICRRVVELMGGRVWEDASPELGGARFTIELPLS